MKLERINYSSGAPLEEKVGYSRMVKIGPYIKIGGTTSVQPDGTVYGEDAYEQTKYVLEKQIKLLEQAGATKENVFSVFIYTTDISQGAKICEAYAEFFHDIKPLNTMVEITRLNRPTQFVEIEKEEKRRKKATETEENLENGCFLGSTGSRKEEKRRKKGGEENYAII